TITSPEGCTLSDKIRITVMGNIDVPAAFTPNNDGMNDQWVIDGIAGYPACEVRVYNRFGETVYYSRGYPAPWDGRSKGSSLPAGTYYYVINLHTEDLQPVSGSLTILY
ncbi:MAG TPA: gliding motility-associated C-terminal domain-containing protein, partial [Anseongella sp.]|nr:gliding motility-associated C-terminal domain-containing protein [Anseongella sp.]